MLGVPGLMDVYRAGNVALANAPGTGVADDKVIYAYVPRDDQVLPGRGADPAQRADLRLLATRRTASTCWTNLDELVVKAANESGGYGMLIGPHATARRSARSSPADSRQPAQLHRPADAVALARADARRRPVRGPPRRPAALHPLRQGHLRAARRPDPRGAAEGLAGGQLVAGRRQQGHLGAVRRRSRSGKRRVDAEPRRRFDLLDEPLHRARREHRALHRRQPSTWSRSAGDAFDEQWGRWSSPPATRSCSPSATTRPRGERDPSFSPSTARIRTRILSPASAARENARSVREIISSEMWEQINAFYSLSFHRAPAMRSAIESTPTIFSTESGVRATWWKAQARRPRPE